MTAGVEEASERVLRSLVPPEDWISERMFVIKTKDHGTWLIDLMNWAHVYQVIRSAPEVNENECTCEDCVRQRKNRSQDFGEYTGRCRPRGMLLDTYSNRTISESRTAQLARAISLVLMFHSKPGMVNQMAC